MTSSETQPLRIIALEEHCLSASVNHSLYRNQTSFPPPVIESLCDVGGGRIKSMDAGGIKLQVLSHTAGYAEDVLSYQAVNNGMAEAVAKNPTRFAAFAHLPVADPLKAADELRRCINELGFKGALVDNHAGGRYYEGLEYNSFWATLEELDVPLYLHPTMPTSTMADWYHGVEWIEQVRASRLLKKEELEMILYRNAELFLNTK